MKFLFDNSFVFLYGLPNDTCSSIIVVPYENIEEKFYGSSQRKNDRDNKVSTR